MQLAEVAYRAAIQASRRQMRVPALLGDYLARPFPSWSRHRILLVYYSDELAEPQFLPFFRYAKRFANKGMAFRACSIASSEAILRAHDATAIFVQGPYERTDTTVRRFLSAARAAYPHLAITFFDWSAPADLRFAQEVAPFIDHYVKKSLLSDRLQYLEPAGGHTNLTDYYSARFALADTPRDWSVPEKVLDRVEVGPLFATSHRLIRQFEFPGPPRRHRSIDVHARIATSGTPWYEAMRNEALHAVRNQLAGLTTLVEGRVSPRRYVHELANAKMCFSPFGYGEICWRDFEAVAYGAVLLKPDMSHLDIAPEVFTPGETYMPLQWDLSDLGSAARDLLGKPERRDKLAGNAFQAIRTYLHGNALTELVTRLLQQS